MHELKHEYTLVIVTHNMQQAARVADMTAFFSLQVEDDGPPRHPRRVRRDREDLHSAVRQAHRGLRHGAVRMSRRTAARADTFHEELDAARGSLRRRRGARRSARSGGARGARASRRRARRRGDRLRRRGRPRAIWRSRRACSRCSRARRRSQPICASCSRCCTCNLHLERIADYCVTVAKLTQARRAGSSPSGARSSPASRRWASGPSR